MNFKETSFSFHGMTSKTKRVWKTELALIFLAHPFLLHNPSFLYLIPSVNATLLLPWGWTWYDPFHLPQTRGLILSRDTRPLALLQRKCTTESTEVSETEREMSCVRVQSCSGTADWLKLPGKHSVFTAVHLWSHELKGDEPAQQTSSLWVFHLLLNNFAHKDMTLLTLDNMHDRWPVINQKKNHWVITLNNIYG